MPYTIPTSAQFKARYPAFVAVDDALMDLVIIDAARNVDEGWEELDYQPAILALTAHLLVEDGATGRNVESAGVVTSSKLGDAQDNYSGLSGFMMNGEYSSTSYGRNFMQLRALNCQAVVLL
jgi:hypothetical protein